MIVRLKTILKRNNAIYRILQYLHENYVIYIVYPLRASNNLKHLKKHYLNTSDELIKEAIRVLNNNSHLMIPFDYIQKYVDPHYKIFSESYGHTGISIDGHKIYFPQKTKKRQIIEAVKNHCVEQDPESPHNYLLDKSKIHGHTAILIGASDGLFALEIVDSFQHIFLFESDPNWIEPLRKTFEPYQQKVTIVNTFISDKTSDKEMTLDGFFNGYKHSVDFLQADVEGAACAVLKGGEGILRDNQMKIALACYHTYAESSEIQNILVNSGFSISFSKKFVYMWMHDLKEPYFRNGVLYAEKVQTPD
jgi:hypothetical protein